ncbi:hypothetical protein [Haladaptatus sp. R4]|uniref:hypothetical protein n=1 Tax=Haladaptatus sp. R4 TaxID=1679489 RepID=UPI001CBF5B19|nr:hypothetical protein [Haladaptatus sp. R4]
MSDSNYEDGRYRTTSTAMLGRGSVVLTVLTVQALAFARSTCSAIRRSTSASRS